jgi:DNA repair exonuclease SbcCD ATPase subunit
MTTKDAYVRLIEAKLEELDAEIRKRKAKAKEERTQAEMKLNEMMDQYRADRQNLEKKLVALRQSGGSAWEDMQEGIDRALGELKASFEQASSPFRQLPINP